MTTVRITLPDALAREAAQAGLLEPQAIETLLRERLAAASLERMQKARTTLRTAGVPPMTTAEIEAEIDGYREERRRAAGA